MAPYAPNAAERQQVAALGAAEAGEPAQEDHDATEAHEQADHAHPGRPLPLAQPGEEQGEHGVGRDEDCAGDRRRAVESQHEPHLIEEVAGDARRDQQRDVAPRRTAPPPRQPQGHERDDRDRQEPHTGERHRIDLAPRHLEGRERRRPHDDHQQQGPIDRQVVANGLRRSGLRGRFERHRPRITTKTKRPFPAPVRPCEAAARRTRPDPRPGPARSMRPDRGSCPGRAPT